MHVYTPPLCIADVNVTCTGSMALASPVHIHMTRTLATELRVDVCEAVRLNTVGFLFG